MKRQGPKPVLKFGSKSAAGSQGLYRVLPFQKSWIAIFILAAMDLVFLLPAIATFNQAITEWAKHDSLFDLVAAIFLSAWLLGWMIAPVLITGILVLMLFGREILIADPGKVEIRIGIPMAGLSVQYKSAKMRNLRYVKPVEKSSTSWRGNHMVFDYGTDSVAVGSAITVEDFDELRSRLRVATASDIRKRDILPGETGPIAPAEKKIASKITTMESAVAEPANQPLSLTSVSSLLLIFVNLLPIVGSVFFNWNLSDIMVLYWAESAVIGFFNACKIIKIGKSFAILAVPFFIGHFGGFMAIHFLFLWTIFVKPDQPEFANTSELVVVADMFRALWPALLGLFISHAFSFYQNFLGRREYLKRTVNKQMSEPYSRIIFMHLALIFGGGLSMALGGSTIVLLIIIVCKIVFDVKAHLKQHGTENTG